MRCLDLDYEKGYMLREINIGIKEQFPEEIEKRRHEGRHVSLVRDKLYIDGELYPFECMNISKFNMFINIKIIV
jgi:hypothetical protein